MAVKFIAAKYMVLLVKNIFENIITLKTQSIVVSCPKLLATKLQKDGHDIIKYYSSL